MSLDFVMPKAGITMDEGTVLAWLVKPGDEFQEGQPLATVETDKASIDVNANEDGVLLEILVPEGQTVPVGTPIARVGKPGEKPGAAPAPAIAQAPAPGARPRISPLAKNLAAKLGVDYAALQGSGPGGRILRRDVEAAAKAAQAAAPTPAPAPASAPAPATTTAGRRIPLTRMRRIIAERMTFSKSTIPQFRVNVEVDVTRTMAFRESLSQLQVKLSFTDFLVQAAAQSLREQPEVNASFLYGSSFVDSAIQLHDQVNVGLAVALDEGLVVPVIHEADQLSLAAIAARREALVEAARSGKALPEQLSGGTFTISNLGPFGIDSFDAIVNPPEAAILAVGRAVRKPVVLEGDTVQIRPMLSLTLTADHRVLDGAAAARFLRSLAGRLELADRYRLL